MSRQRRFSAAQAEALALRSIEADIGAREDELGALRRARELVQRAADERSGHCEQNSEHSPCSGTVWSQFCRICGDVVRRCEGAHGGLAAAGDAMRAHLATHGLSSAATTRRKA